MEGWFQPQRREPHRCEADERGDPDERDSRRQRTRVSAHRPRRRTGDTSQPEAKKSTGGQTPGLHNLGRTGNCVLQSAPMEGKIWVFLWRGSGYR